jgi:hypothetical protein
LNITTLAELLASRGFLFFGQLSVVRGQLGQAVPTDNGPLTTDKTGTTPLADIWNAALKVHLNFLRNQKNPQVRYSLTR